MDWQQNILTETARIRDLLAATQTVAVLGIKTEAQAGQPAFYVPRYLAAVGYEVIPVPVYYPEVTHILGQRVYRRLVEIPGAVDLVDVFRRPEDWSAMWRTSWPSGPRRCGCSRASGTTRGASGWRRPGSKWCRIGV
jgi:predicted CoA-binding protein